MCFIEFLLILLFKEYIDPQHAQAFENLRKSMKTPSRVSHWIICNFLFIAVFCLKNKNVFTSIKSMKKVQTKLVNILCHFQLHLLIIVCLTNLMWYTWIWKHSKVCVFYIGIIEVIVIFVCHECTYKFLIIDLIFKYQLHIPMMYWILKFTNSKQL